MRAGIINPATKRDITQNEYGEGVLVNRAILMHIQRKTLVDVKKHKRKPKKKLTPPDGDKTLKEETE